MFSKANCRAPISNTVGNLRVLNGCGRSDQLKDANKKSAMVVNIADRIFTMDRVEMTDNENCKIIKPASSGDIIVCNVYIVNGVQQNPTLPSEIATVKIDNEIWQGKCIEIKKNAENDYDLIIDGIKKNIIPSHPTNIQQNTTMNFNRLMSFKNKYCQHQHSPTDQKEKEETSHITYQPF